MLVKELMRYLMEIELKFTKHMIRGLFLITPLMLASCGHRSIQSMSFYGGKSLIHPSPYKNIDKGWPPDEELLVYEGSLSLSGVKLVVRGNFDVYLNDQYYGNIEDVKRLEIRTDGTLTFDGSEKRVRPERHGAEKKL